MSINKDPLATEVIDLNEAIGQFFGAPRDVVPRYTQCPYCGSRLHFTQVTDFSRNTTHETSKCPECGIRVRQVLHRLQ